MESSVRRSAMPAVSQRMPSLSSAERHSSWAHSAEKTAPAIGAATGGSGSRSDESRFRTLDAVTLTDGDFDKLRNVSRQPAVYSGERADARERAIRAAQRLHRKKDLLDLLVVGGITVADILRSPDAVPPEIERAFELALSRTRELG